MIHYKKDLGEEVIKEGVATQRLKQEAEFTVCLSKRELYLQGSV